MASSVGHIAKHASVYALGNLFLRIGSFFLLPLYTHYLSVASFGILELFSSISSIISSLLGVGLAHSTLRFYFVYEEIEKKNTVVTTSCISSIIISCPILIIICLFNEKISVMLFNSKDYNLALNLIYLTIGCELIRQIGLAYFRAKEYSLMYVSLCAAQFIIQVTVNIYTVAFRNLDVTGVLIGNFLSVFFGASYCFVIIIKQCGLKFDKNIIKDIIKYSYPFFMSAFSGVISGNADRFIIKAFLSLEALGIYSLAIKFGAIIGELILDPFQKIYGSHRFSIKNIEEANIFNANILNYLLIILGVTGISVSVFSSLIIRYLTTPDYFHAIPYIHIIIIATTIYGLSYVFATGLLIHKRTFTIFLNDFFTQWLGLAIGFVMIKRFGIYGACLTLVLKSGMNSILTNYFSQKVYPISYEYSKIWVWLIYMIMYYCINFFIIGDDYQDKLVFGIVYILVSIFILIRRIDLNKILTELGLKKQWHF